MMSIEDDLFCERTNNFRGDVEKEDGGDEGEGEDEDDEGVSVL